jgi:hypothetical protein
MAWFDRQFGLGYGSNGWNLFIFLLENGVKATVWHANSVNDIAQRFVTSML